MASFAVENNSLIRTIDTNSSVYSVATSDDLIVCGLRDYTVQVWHSNGSFLRTFKGHTEAVGSVAIWGTTIVSGSDDNTVKVWRWDWSSENFSVLTLDDHTKAVDSVAIMGRWIVSGSRDKTVKVWNTDGKLLNTLKGHSRHVSSVAISNTMIIDGSDFGVIVVSGSGDRTIKIWSHTNETLLKTLKGHTNDVYSIAILGTDRIVSGSNDRTIKIWNTNGECLKTLEGHEDYISSVAILGTDRIVSAGLDGNIKIWDVDNGECLKTFQANQSYNAMSVAILGTDRLVSADSEDTIRIWDVSDVARVADDESKGEERNDNKKKYTIGIQNAMMLNRMIDTDRIQKLLDFEGTWSFNDSDPNNIGLSLKPAGAFAFEDFVLDLAVEIIDEMSKDPQTFIIIEKAREEYRKRVVDRRVDRTRIINTTFINAVYTVDKARRLATIKLVDYFEEDGEAQDIAITPEEFRARKKKYNNSYGDNVLNEVDREKRDIENQLGLIDSQLKPITKEKIRLNKAHKEKVAAEKNLIARKNRLKAWQKKIKKLTLEEYQELLRQTYLTQMKNCTNDIDMINKRPWLAEDFKSTVFFRFPDGFDKYGNEKFKTFCLTDSSVSKQKKKEKLKVNPMAKVLLGMLKKKREELTNPDLNEQDRQQIQRRIDQLEQQINSFGSALQFNSETAEGMALDQAVSKDHWIENMLYANWVEQDGSPYDVNKKVVNSRGDEETREGRGGKPGSDRYVRITSIMGGGDLYIQFDTLLKQVIRIKRGDGRRREQSEIGFVLPQGWTYPVAVYLKFEKRVAIGNIRGEILVVSGTHGNRYANIYKVTQIANFNHYDDINVVNECEGDCESTTTVSGKKRKTRLLKF